MVQAMVSGERSIWAELCEVDRKVVALREQICVRILRSGDRAGALGLVLREYAGVRGVSKSSVYRWLDGYGRDGLAGLIDRQMRQRAGLRDGDESLPAGFVLYWQQQFTPGGRDKVLNIWHRLMGQLIGGAVMPGYECDWRGIWSREHPGLVVPVRCPYAADHTQGRHKRPVGWSYENLNRLAPSKAVRMGLSRGRGALLDLAPDVPRTRVGLGLMSCITMDDVQHDLEVKLLNRSSSDRPLEIGAIDILTGRFIGWICKPTIRRDDKSRVMLDKLDVRYLQAHLFCGIGVNPSGLLEILEHGTAGMDDAERVRINGILDRAKPRQDGRSWLYVQRSGTSGAALCSGYFSESAKGNSRMKACLESRWNLLHNRLDHLAGQIGKDHASRPGFADAGWHREDDRLMKAIVKLGDKDPRALQLLDEVQYHAIPFKGFCKALAAVKQEINLSSDHNLEGWDECGYTREIAHINGADVALDDVSADKRAQLKELVRLLGAPVSLRRMSPEEAWNYELERTQLVRFDAFVACEILGDELRQESKVTTKGELKCKDKITGETLTFTAVATDERGAKIHLVRGADYGVWHNPYQQDVCLVCDSQGRFIGACRRLVAACYTDLEGQQRAMGLANEVSAETLHQVGHLLAPTVAQEERRRAKNKSLLAQYVEDGVAPSCKGKGKARERKPAAVSIDEMLY